MKPCPRTKLVPKRHDHSWHRHCMEAYKSRARSPIAAILPCCFAVRGCASGSEDGLWDRLQQDVDVGLDAGAPDCSTDGTACWLARNHCFVGMDTSQPRDLSLCRRCGPTAAGVRQGCCQASVRRQAGECCMAGSCLAVRSRRADAIQQRRSYSQLACIVGQQCVAFVELSSRHSKQSRQDA